MCANSHIPYWALTSPQCCNDNDNDDDKTNDSNDNDNDKTDSHIIASGSPRYIVFIALEACLDCAICTASISINRIAVVAFLVRCLDSVAAGTSAAARVA